MSFFSSRWTNIQHLHVGHRDQCHYADKMFCCGVPHPVFIVPCTAIAILGAWLGRVYMKAQIAIKREMSNARAPVLGHFGAAVAGLSSCCFDVRRED